MRERPSACMLEEAFCGTQDPVRASRSQSSTWPTPPHLTKSSDIRRHRAGVRPSVGLAGPFRDIAWAPYRGIFLIHRSIAYAHRYGGACNSRGVLRGRGSGLCTTNMARSITEARLPREIAQSSAPVSFADSTRAARRIVPPARIFIAFTDPSPAISSRPFQSFEISDLPPVHSSLSCNNLYHPQSQRPILCMDS